MQETREASHAEDEWPESEFLATGMHEIFRRHTNRIAVIGGLFILTGKGLAAAIARISVSRGRGQGPCSSSPSNASSLRVITPNSAALSALEPGLSPTTT